MNEFLKRLQWNLSARTGLSDDQLKEQPVAGSLFVLKKIGFTGLPSFEFNG
jgi:hypothetical protein